ncbi:BA75_00995T0 [Komagataella pastoris]|uniref:BA75_00995T0 n=1 Tax=Komagataella pastoris TaxID=4922 RepID=A0A1B2J5Q0_PICPA|nr:BA75_00995T0 [Komagataella pastoris]
MVLEKQRLNPFKILRLGFIILFFFSGCLSIVISQIIVKILFCSNPLQQQRLLNFTKRNFIILLTFVTSLVSPTKIIITHDESIPKGTFTHHKTFTGNDIVRSALCPQAIVVANHQIYTDWLFMWWFAFISDVSDNVYIIMKKSLSRIPVLGYGMTNYRFIFLSRKWEDDKSTMIRQLKEITHFYGQKSAKAFDDLKKHWLIIFPEGTNMSDNRREISNEYIEKNGLQPLKHVLSPRAKGLYVSVEKLSSTTKYIYDLTIAYSGHTPEEYAQDIYTLSQIFIHGKGPHSVNIHIRALDLHQIAGVNFDPEIVNSANEIQEANLVPFQNWLYKIWYEKDALMDQFFKTKSFGPQYESIETELKLFSKWELFSIFTPTWLLLLGFYLIIRLLSMTF